MANDDDKLPPVDVLAIILSRQLLSNASRHSADTFST